MCSDAPSTGGLTDRMRSDSVTGSMAVNVNKLQEVVAGGETWHAAVHGVAQSEA